MLGSLGGAPALGCRPSSDPTAANDASVVATAPLTPPRGPGGGSTRRAAEAEGRQATEAAPAAVSAFDEAMRLGDAALYSGRFETARVHFLRAMELNPDAMAAALGAVRSLVIAGQAEARQQVVLRIERQIDRFMADEATVGSGWLLAARLATAQHDPGRALDAGRLAVQALPEMGVSWRVLGEAALMAGHWSEAVSAFETSVRLGLEAEAGAWERLADARDELGKLAQAEAAARHALKLTGADVHAKRRRLNLLAVILKHQMRLEEAERIAGEALASDPRDPAVLHNLGAIAEALGHVQEARTHYEAAVRVAPVPMTYWRLGHLWLKLDRPEEALAAFKRAAAHLERWTWPVDERWRPAMDAGKLLARAGLWVDAVGWFEDALREARDVDALREVQSWVAFARLQ